MSASTAGDGGGPAAVATSSFFLKILALAVAFIVVGLVAPVVMGENEFIGLLVGMSWSLGIIIIAVLVVAVLAAAIRSAMQ